MLKARFIDKGSKSFPYDKLYIFAENETVNFHNKQFLTNFSGEIFVYN